MTNISFEKTVYGICVVYDDDWYINDKRVMLGSIGMSEEDSFYYFQPSGHMLYDEQLEEITAKVKSLNYPRGE